MLTTRGVALGSKHAASHNLNWGRYILVVNDAESIDGEILPSDTLAKRRFESNNWPLYQNTPHRKEIKPGDQCLVYLAGKRINSQHFVAVATVSSVNDAARVPTKVETDVMSVPPVSFVCFDKVTTFIQPVPIRDLLTKLSFIPHNANSWGCVMQRGCKRISEKDFHIVVSHSHEKN